MFSDTKWARFVAERGRPGMDGPPPDELHVVPANFTHLQAPNYQSIQDAPSIGYQASVFVDTPVAGFAIPTLLAVGPRDGGERVVIAAAANPDTRHFMHPGVFTYNGWWLRVAGPTSGMAVRWEFLGARTTDPLNQANIEPFPGSFNRWTENIILPISVNCCLPFEGTIYAPRPWIVALMCVGGLVDADVFETHISIYPTYLFDEAGAT